MEIWVHIVIILVILAIITVIAAICCTRCVDGGAYEDDIKINNASLAYQMLINKFPSLTVKYVSGDFAVSASQSGQINFSIIGMNPKNGNNFEIEYENGESDQYKTLDELETDIKNLLTPPEAVEPTPLIRVKANPAEPTPLIRVKANPVEDRISNFNSAINKIRTQFPSLIISTGTQYSATVFTPDYTHKFSIFGLNPISSQSISPKFQLEYPNLDTSDFNTLEELSTAIQMFLNTPQTVPQINSNALPIPSSPVLSNKPKTKNNVLNNVRNNISKKIQNGMCNIL